MSIILILVNLLPAGSSPISYDSLLPPGLVANMCYLWDIWCHYRIFSNCCITNSVECTICPLSHAWAHRDPWLACVAVIDRGECVCRPFHSESMADFVLLDSQYYGLMRTRSMFFGHNSKRYTKCPKVCRHLTITAIMCLLNIHAVMFRFPHIFDHIAYVWLIKTAYPPNNTSTTVKHAGGSIRL